MKKIAIFATGILILLLAIILFCVNNSKMLINVCKNNLWGYIDKKNNVVVPLKYDWAGKFENGIGIVQLKTKFGAVNSKNKEVIPVQYDGLQRLQNGKLMVLDENGSIQINKRNKKVRSAKYEERTFYDGVAVAIKDGKYGYIDKKGKTKLAFIFDEAQNYKNKVYVVKYKEYFGALNSNKKNIIPFRYAMLTSLDKNEFMACTKLSKDGIISDCGVIDKKEKVIIPLIYSDVKKIDRNTYLVHDINSNRFYVNKNGENKFEKKFYIANEFKNGIAPACVEYNKCGFINKKGDFVIDPIYQATSEVQNGLIAAMLDNKWGFINKKGKTIIPFEYDWTGYIY